MERWEVSTTTARKVLDELAAAGFARKEGTRGHISTGGPRRGQRRPRGNTAQSAAASRGPWPADCLACSYDPGSRERRAG